MAARRLEALTQPSKACLSVSAGEEALRQQFLPAALEIQETPPSPAGRWLLGTLLLLFTIGILWATFGRVDIVVSAPGRIIPSGQVKRVQAPETGVVVAILVSEGERVEAGQPLIRLDPTYADADDLRIREKLHDISVESAWRRALDQWLADGMDATSPPALPTRFAAADQSKAGALYQLNQREILARIRGQEKELAANRAEQQSVRAERERAEATLAVLVQRVDAYRTLLEQQYGAKVQYLEMLQQQTELDRSIPILVSRQEQLMETAAAINARMDAIGGELRKNNLMELARLDSDRRGLEQESRKARQRQQQLTITTPVTGAIQELAVHTLGGVVSPAEELLKIVPENASIEVEALLQNKDIGFVSEGQLAEVKVDTFNFTKYGLIDAQVVNIGSDSVEDPQLGWVFKLRLRLDHDSIAVEDKIVQLSPGMAITAEIRTGKRRLIEFFLSPLLRYKQESVRER
jgi:hemolysin D